MKIAILAFYGRQKRNISSNRIYGLLRGLSNLGVRVYLFTAPTSLPPDECFDTSFCEDVVEFSAIPIPDRPYELGRRILQKFAGRVGIELGRISGSIAERSVVSPNLKSGLRTWRYTSPIFRSTLNDRGYWVLGGLTLYKLLRYILENDIRVLLTSHIPPMAHRFGVYLKKRMGPQLFWVADFRDPMIGHDYAQVGYSKRLASIQRETFELADLVTMVSQSMIQDALTFIQQEALEVNARKFLCLYNGFYEFQSVPLKGNIFRDSKLLIAYTGTLYRGKQDLSVLFRAISSLSQEERRNIEFIYAGPQAGDVQSMVSKYQIQSLCRILGMVEKEAALGIQSISDILLVLKSDTDRGGFTGKFFEYLFSGKPILVVGDRDEEFNDVAMRIGGVKIVPNGHEGSQQITEIIRALLRASSLQEEIIAIFGERKKSEVDKFHWNSLARHLYERILHDIKGASEVHMV